MQFVLNYEEGGENCVLHGDPASETFLSEIVDAQPFPARHMSMESLYEYGSRAGVWRVLRLFRERRLPLTVFGVGMALARNPAVVDAFLADGHEIASHGWRWITYQQVDEYIEREHMALAVDTITRLTGRPPDGWYTGRDSPNTRRLVVEHGGFVYYADGYADDLPYYVPVRTRLGVTPLLVVPYTLDTNDMRFATPQGFNSGEQFSRVPEGRVRRALRRRRPARPRSRRRCCRSACIAGSSAARARRGARTLPRPRAPARRRLGHASHRHRAALARHAPVTPRSSPRDARPTSTRRTARRSLPHWAASSNTRRGSPNARTRRVRSNHARRCTRRWLAAMYGASRAEQLALLRAHPELAGRAAIRGQLTADSTEEQAGAGLTQCSPDEFARLNELKRVTTHASGSRSSSR